MAVATSNPNYAPEYAASAVGGLLGYGNAPAPLTVAANGNAAGGGINPYAKPASSVLGTSTSTGTDPYAQYGGQAAYNGLKSAFDTQNQGIIDSSSAAAGNAGIGVKGSIQDLIDSLTVSQRGIDQQAVQNDLSKRQGTQGVLDMVGHGLQSGGVILANKNASDSSASQALANAYGQLGREQLSSVGNQYAQGQNAVQNSQANLDTQTAAGIRHIQDSKTQVVNGIVSAAQQQLGALNTAMAYASLPDRINIAQEMDKVRTDAAGQLQQYDALLNQGTAGIKPQDAQTNLTQANTLATAGVAPENSFEYTSQAPAQFQGTGPLPSSLPLFQLNRKQTA